MAIGPFRIVVAHGKSDETVSDDTVNAAETTHDVTGHPYEVDDLIFVSQSDDSAIQYLGPVLSKNADDFTTTWETNASKGASAKFWTPTDSVAFSRDTQRTFPKDWDTQARGGKTRGGVPWKIGRGSNAKDDLTYTVSAGEAEDIEAFKAFLIPLNNGVGFFALAWYDFYDSLTPSHVDKVLWPDRVLRRNMQDGIKGITQYTVRFSIHTEDAVVE